MGVLSNGSRSRQQRGKSKSSSDYINSIGDTRRVSDKWQRDNNGKRNIFFRLVRLLTTNKLYNNRSDRCVPVHSKLPRTWYDEPNNNTTDNHNRKRHRHNKHIYAIATIGSLLSPNVALAEGVGGVSATANPIANSSGSVTNQAIQVLQGPYITNTYGGGVQCQGSTFNVTPYIQYADSRKHPWEDFYNEPQYNVTDISGRTVEQTITVKNYPWESWYDDRTKADGTRWFPDGEDMEITVDVPAGDGVPDAVQNGNLEPTWFKPVRTDMKANQSFNFGVSATLSIPMNRKLQKQCQEAAQAQINLATQVVSNKRLDFELARLKNCGELKKQGIFFHPKSQYAAICADVVVTAPGGMVIPHEHNLPQPKWINPSSSPSDQSEVDLSTSDILGLPIQIGTSSSQDDQTSSSQQ